MDAKRLFKEYILPFGLEIIALLLIVKFVFFFVIVPSGSMIPTVEEHSLLFATRIHNVENLKRGDIVVFKSDELGKNLVKRLIGLPGESVWYEDGNLYVDGVLIEEDYVVNKDEGDSFSFLVPEGCYLFLGDNRTGSYDARRWSQPYISADKLMGKAVFTIWPFKNFGVLR